MSTIFIRGMHGMGDCIHQRAIVRELIKTGAHVWLETPWASIYHDLVGPHLALVSKGSALRTQAKNAAREANRFTRLRPPSHATQLQVSYAPDQVRRQGSVLGAMSKACRVPVGDFTLPIPRSWREKAQEWIAGWNTQKPLLIYRPLVERKEWGGCRARNPDHAAYADLYESVRERFFVVSVADLEPGKEWMVGRPIDADVELHLGELEFETLAALMSEAALVYTSPGFAAVLAQAVGTPVCCVFGGYENAKSFSAGARFAPYLGIEPGRPCDCFRHDHRCDKRIDVPAAIQALQAFIDIPLERAA